MSKTQSSNVDGRCDSDELEYQRSEGGNKPSRQSEGRCVARVLHLSQRFKSPCEAHGMVRWGSPKTPSQKPILMQIDRPVFGTSRSKRFPHKE